MFLDFFYTLRRHKIPVALTEWRVLMQALSMGFAQTSMERFYTLARSLLVKDVSYYDAYDLAFQETFHGIATPDAIIDEILAWLQDPHTLAHLTPAQLALLQATGSRSATRTLCPASPGAARTARSRQPHDRYGWNLAFRP